MTRTALIGGLAALFAASAAVAQAPAPSPETPAAEARPAAPRPIPPAAFRTPEEGFAAFVAALRQPDLEVRVSEALPWVAVHHADLDWSWLVRQAKLHDVQNRLGFVVGLAADLAERSGRTTVRAALDAVTGQLERARLAREDTLCRESMPTPERRWLAVTRSALAQHWNLLTGLTVEQLVHA